MTGQSPRGRVAWRSLALGCLALAMIAAYLVPHAHRLGHPSIFGDDVARIYNVETQTLPGALTTPFNEHVAPVFDAVTWISWLASGRRLSSIPAAFTIAAYVPFLLAIAALAALARRDLGSWPAAVVVVAAFAVAPIHVVESVWWYSGSNHMWAVFGMLVGLLGAGRGGVAGALAACVGSASAPACSMMGVLAAPAIMLYSWSGRGRRGHGTASAAAAGLLSYAAFGMAFGLVNALLHGREFASHPASGLSVAVEAPAVVLVPALFGLRDLYLWVPPTWALAASGVFAVATLAWAAKDRRRALILVGLFLVFGGYLLIYPFRTAGGRTLMFRTARYHLFPQLGLALLVGAAARRALAGPRGTWIAAAFCAGLLAIHLPRMIAESSLYDFPNQANTLAALERVRAACLAEGITDKQAIAALEPIRPHWMLLDRGDANVAKLIGRVDVPSRVADAEVRGRLLAALGPEDREGLFGGMDAGRYLVLADVNEGSYQTVDEGRAAGSLNVRPTGRTNEYVTGGWPSHLEYDLVAPARTVGSARWLALPVSAPGGGVEVWWDDGRGGWSDGRSIRWHVDASKPQGRIWAVPLDRLPHWDGGQVRKVRVAFRYPGVVFASPPKLASRKPDP